MATRAAEAARRIFVLAELARLLASGAVDGVASGVSCAGTWLSEIETLRGAGAVVGGSARQMLTVCSSASDTFTAYSVMPLPSKDTGDWLRRMGLRRMGLRICPCAAWLSMVSGGVGSRPLVSREARAGSGNWASGLSKYAR